MVKLIYFIFIIILSYACYSKNQVFKTIDQDSLSAEAGPYSVELEIAYNSPDSVICFRDSVDLIVSLKNEADTIVDLKYYITLNHYTNRKIFETLPQITLNRNKPFNKKNKPYNYHPIYSDSIKIPPQSIHKLIYKIEVTKEFFSVEYNKVFIRFSSWQYFTVSSDPVEVIALDCY